MLNYVKNERPKKFMLYFCAKIRKKTQINIVMDVKMLKILTLFLLRIVFPFFLILFILLCSINLGFEDSVSISILSLITLSFLFSIFISSSGLYSTSYSLGISIFISNFTSSIINFSVPLLLFSSIIFSLFLLSVINLIFP